MRWTLVGTLGLSLASHCAVVGFFLSPHLGPTAVEAAPENGGKTFELPAPETAETPLANASPAIDTSAEAAPIEVPDAPARPVPPTRAESAARPGREGRPSAGRAKPATTEDTPGSSRVPSPFGAVGDRSAADLSRAFTRDFPTATSVDPVWTSAPLGSAGEATVILTLDETGHIQDVRVIGDTAGPLAQGIRQTIALIKGRPFIARSRVTKLRIAATISSDTVHDGLHGDVYAIGRSEGEGSSFFALKIGRRVDVRVRSEAAK